MKLELAGNPTSFRSSTFRRSQFSIGACPSLRSGSRDIRGWYWCWRSLPPRWVRIVSFFSLRLEPLFSLYIIWLKDLNVRFCSFLVNKGMKTWLLTRFSSPPASLPSQVYASCEVGRLRVYYKQRSLSRNYLRMRGPCYHDRLNQLISNLLTKYIKKRSGRQSFEMLNCLIW